MRYTILIIVLFISTSVLLPQNSSKIPDSLIIRTLLTTILDKDFTPDREVKVDYIELPPNTVLERHWHPGEEFHYYLEGEVEIKIEGESSIKGVPGTVGHVPYKKPHLAIAGKSGARILVFRVHTKGEPWRFIDTTEIKN